MTELPIKVINRDEVVQKAKELIGIIKAVYGKPSFDQWVSMQQSAHRLNIAIKGTYEKPICLCDPPDYPGAGDGGVTSDCPVHGEEPAPKWEPGMWAWCKNSGHDGLNPFQIEHIYDGRAYQSREQLHGCSLTELTPINNPYSLSHVAPPEITCKACLARSLQAPKSQG